MAIEIISRSISAKVWDQVEIELGTPGLAVRRITGKHEMVLCMFFVLDTGKTGTLANSEDPDEMVLLALCILLRNKTKL